MSGLSKRRDADIDRLKTLEERSRGQLQITHLPKGADNTIRFQLNLPTAGGPEYPTRVQPAIRFQVELPARYPFEAPVARLGDTPVYHPNVFESGVICVGSKWNPSEGLDVYVTRLCKLLTFDGMLVNLRSIAHAAAGNWYSSARRANPKSFPSAVIDWESLQDKVIRACPNCSANLRLPTGRSGAVSCPKCRREFETTT